MTGAEIEAEARTWISVPFRKRGRSRKGIDCLGLLVMVGRSFNVPHEDRLDYLMYPREDNLILAELGKYLHREPAAPFGRPGVIGVFAELRNPGHVGIFSRQRIDGRWRPHVIHARRVPPCVTEDAWEMLPREQIRLVGLFSLPGMDD